MPYMMLRNHQMKLVRHLFLISVFFIVSLSQNLSFYDSYPEIGNKVNYLFTAINTVVYLAVAYLHIYKLVPRYLARKKYSAYLAISFLLILLAMLIRYCESVVACNIINSISLKELDTAAIWNYISDSALTFLCMTGVSLTVLMKNLMEEEKTISELENRLLSHDIESIKNIIDPQILLQSLHLSGKLSSECAERSAELLIKLSTLLRYQLYETSKNKVPLRSEIDFLENYLGLMKNIDTSLEYKVEDEGEICSCFIPPLLFIPFVKTILSGGENKAISVKYAVSNNILQFTCSGDISPADTAIMGAANRLSTLYGDKFTYTINDRILNISLEL